MAVRKSWVRMMSVLFVVAFVLAIAPSVDATDHGIVRENGVDLYRDNDGNLHTVVVIKGIPYVEFPLELIPLKDMQEADGGAAISLPAAGRIGPLTAVSPVSYSQRYSAWSGTTLGNGPSTIGTAGCYLTSAATC